MEEEVWKDIAGYEGLYQVSSFGNVKSIARNGTLGGILKPGKSTPGYYIVVLCKNSRGRTRTVHTLVWDAFKEEKRNGRILCVDHNDNDKSNNHLSNLQLLTTRNNITKGIRNKNPHRLTGTTFFQGKWQSTIAINGIKTHLGNFETEAEAHEAYLKEKSKL